VAQDGLPDGTPRAAAATNVVEAVVAALVLILGIVLIVESRRLGAGWTNDGPGAGYFPFYIGLILCFSSAMTIIRAVRDRAGSEPFVERGQARLVLAVFIPTVVYVIAVKLLGIYVASAIFIGAFMAWQGKFRWIKCVTVSVLVSVALFLMFEIWFKVPLPKGPLEAMFGY
jgi:hypothetical protein